MNANTQTAPALEDGQWYWVRYDIGFGADAIEAPARYRAQIDCFYSHQFSGIPAREVEVLGPALRSPPADLTFDALLKRIKASPFRDDMALANLIVFQAEQIKALAAGGAAGREECAISRDDVISQALRCGVSVRGHGDEPLAPGRDSIERFFRMAYTAGATAEREACAHLAQQYAGQVGDVAWTIAGDIRARSRA